MVKTPAAVFSDLDTNKISVPMCQAYIQRGRNAAAGNAKIRPERACLKAAVWMAEGDVPMSQISQFLGHTNTKITESVYARFSPDFLRHAAVALNI